MKPHQLFLFGLLVAVPSLALLLVYPERGIPLYNDVNLVFPGFRETFTPSDERAKARIAAILEESGVSTATNPDEIRRIDSLKAARVRDSLRRQQLKLHYPHGADTLLHPFYERLSIIKSARKAVHILHFGDSQIEGDRITDFLRFKLQSRFGGSGPGWLPAMPYVGSRSFIIENSPEWQHYSLFGLQDSTLSIENHGPMGLFARYKPLLPDSMQTDTGFTEASIHYASRGNAWPPVKNFRKLRLLSGGNESPVEISLLRNGQLIVKDNLPASKHAQRWDFDLPFITRTITLRFRGRDSPAIYAVSLEGEQGVLVSNIALRGQAGTHFRTVPSSIWQEAFEGNLPELIILQFGGNVLPYVNNREEIREYASYFAGNIRFLQSILNAPVIVIGPADMARKESVTWESFPLLSELQSELRTAVFEAGAMYWDTRAAMGGEGAIQQWVLADPPLATSDHIHFTIEGGELIAQWFYDALMRDYQAFLDKHTTLQ